MSHSPNRPTKELSLDREKVAWELRVKGWSQDKIASELSVSQPAISKMLAKSTSKYQSAYLEDIGRVKSEQVAQLEHIYTESMEAWERSKSGDYNVGESRYLQTAMKAKEDIRKTIGADSPLVTKNLHLGMDFTQLSEEQLNDIINGKYFK